MQLRVDQDLCEANAVCCGLAPDVFELDADERLLILRPEPPEQRVERIRLAVDRCPKNALELLA